MVLVAGIVGLVILGGIAGELGKRSQAGQSEAAVEAAAPVEQANRSEE
jgi:hypothetical protein